MTTGIDELLERLRQLGLISELDRYFTRFVLELADGDIDGAGAGDGSAENDGNGDGLSGRAGTRPSAGHDADHGPVETGREPLGRDDREALALATLLVSAETGNGNVCINLPALAGRPLFELPDDPARDWPPRPPRWPAWRAALRRCSVVGEPPEAFRPLILDARGRLYLYRYWDYEYRLGIDLARRASDVEDLDIARLGDGLQRLFRAPAGGTPTAGSSAVAAAPDWQQLAAATALLRRLCVISGGPGTGKTTTVVRILALLLEQQPELRIALAAPTGKAAARLQEAIVRARQALPVSDDLRELIPTAATTIHRLLGSLPDSGHFRHHRERPLTLDVLVVDEASMVDLALMTKLTDALPTTARLILLGDKDQLASVEAGAVLGDICGPATTAGGAGAEPVALPCSPRQRERLQRLLGGAPLPAATATGRRTAPLADSVVLLQHSYRFDAASGIGALARAVNRGDDDGALEVLRAAGDDLGWRTLRDPADLEQALRTAAADGFAAYLELIRAGAEPAEIFAAFDRFRVLGALRNGPYGTEGCNRLIEAALQSRRLIRCRPAQPWYQGRPVMVTRNDHGLRLYNGDVGIMLRDRDDHGKLKVFFESATGAMRTLSPARLPQHETVYAMTVHKSQGSEFDRVVVVLPPEGSRILSRELLYTGITRARRRVEVWGDEQVFCAAARRRLQRTSGLRDALWHGADAAPGAGRAGRR